MLSIKQLNAKPELLPNRAMCLHLKFGLWSGVNMHFHQSQLSGNIKHLYLLSWHSDAINIYTYFQNIHQTIQTFIKPFKPVTFTPYSSTHSCLNKRIAQ